MNQVKLWLITCSILVIMIIWIGGITRLTNSGLAITEWKPITGIMPPLTVHAWIQEKIKYENTPEYKQINFDITIGEFKRIYIIEYTHRLFARLIGLVFFLPLIYFLVQKKLEKRTIVLMIVVLLLGSLQGLIGWYMVQSGLIHQPHVSQYRLAFHLFLATIIFAILWWEACRTNNTTITKSTRSLLLSIIILIILQIAIGGFVAGLKAGLTYSTFPLMDGKLIPNGLFFIFPYWKNIFENVTMVQFLHRVVGVSILIHAMILYYINKNKFTLSMLAAVTIQVALGILTLIYHVPIITASLHQIMAFIVFSISISYYRNTRSL